MVPSDPSDNSPDTNLDALIDQLRRKEGTWVTWGRACQALQKAGMGPQEIFESTGFEPIHQNQVIVAAQVYDSIADQDLPESVLEHFQQRDSELLYEMRVLSRDDRARAAAFARHHDIDLDVAKELIKALKEYSYLREPPAAFTDTVGDIAAYHYWKLARQQSDLRARSRLISQGLRFAKTAEARQQVEALLTDFTVVKSRPAPRLPLFRLEDESEIPRIIPVAGELPLPTADYQAVPVTDSEAPFGVVKFSGTGAWAPIPGWQVVMQAEDPVGILARAYQIPNISNPESREPVLLIVDRRDRDWSDQSYFLADQSGELTLQWFPEVPDLKLLGRLLVLLRPRRVLDENYTHELWQFEE